MTKDRVMSLQELHDALIASKPEGASCPDDCPFCLARLDREVATEIDPEGGTNVSKTYEETEVQALVSAAVAKATEDLHKELDTFKTSQQAEEIEAKIAAAKAEGEEALAELQKKLDEAVLDAEKAKKERDELNAWLTEEATKIEQEAQVAALRDERVAKVAEVATFPEDYVKERADAWASLTDEAFEALLADYKAVASKEETPASPGPISRVSAMQATRETTNGNGKVGSAVREIIGMRTLGVDPRTIR